MNGASAVMQRGAEAERDSLPENLGPTGSLIATQSLRYADSDAEGNAVGKPCTVSVFTFHHGNTNF